MQPFIAYFIALKGIPEHSVYEGDRTDVYEILQESQRAWSYKIERLEDRSWSVFGVRSLVTGGLPGKVDDSHVHEVYREEVSKEDTNLCSWKLVETGDV